MSELSESSTSSSKENEPSTRRNFRDCTNTAYSLKRDSSARALHKTSSMTANNPGDHSQNRSSSNHSSFSRDNHSVLSHSTSPLLKRTSQQWVACVSFLALVTLFCVRREEIQQHVVVLDESFSSSSKRRQSFLGSSSSSNSMRGGGGLGSTSKKKVVQVNPIRQISILGERNSGTRWTYECVFYIFFIC